MDKLSDLKTWLQNEVKPYWENEIDGTQFSEVNKNDMKVVLSGLINSLSAKIDTYSINENAFRDILQSIYTYIMVKHELIYPDSVPEVPDLLDNNDLRSLFLLWTYDLPETVTGMFIIQEIEEIGIPTGDGEIVVGYDYEALSGIFVNQYNADTTEIYNYRNAVTSGIRDRITCQMWDQSGESPTRAGLNIRDYALIEMKMQDILDKFGIVIIGING